MNGLTMRLHATVPALALALVSAFFGIPKAQADNGPNGPFRALTHNVMLMNPIAGDFSNTARANLVAESDYVKGYDVVAFQEAFDNGPVDLMKSRLAAQYPYQTPVLGRSSLGWDQTIAPPLWRLWPEDGGVTIVSKWPIVRKVQGIYGIGCGFDALAAKGFVYAELDVRGKHVHVVATHLQSNDSLCIVRNPATIRASQFAAIDRFLDAQQIPVDEPVMVMGDMNVARSSPEHAIMLAGLDTVAPTTYGGSATSFDPVGNSLAAARYPGATGEDLDYVLLRRENVSPGMWTNTVLSPKSPPWIDGSDTYNDYSDHYPVAGGWTPGPPSSQ